MGPGAGRGYRPGKEGRRSGANTRPIATDREEMDQAVPNERMAAIIYRGLALDGLNGLP